MANTNNTANNSNSNSNPGTGSHAPSHTAENQSGFQRIPAPKTASLPVSEAASLSSNPSQSLDGNMVKNGTGVNRNAATRSAWRNLSNGVAPTTQVGPVMGAALWPALADSARNSSKSASDSISARQGIEAASSSSQVNIYANPNRTANHFITCQSSMNDNGSNPSLYGGSQHQHVPGPPVQLSEVPPNNRTLRDHSQRSGFTRQSRGGNENAQQRNSFRERAGGSQSHGQGPHHHNYGRRRDQDRGNQYFGNRRNFNGGVPPIQSQNIVPGFAMASQTAPPYHDQRLLHTLVRPYPVQLGYTEHPPPASYVGTSSNAVRGNAILTSAQQHPAYITTMKPEPEPEPEPEPPLSERIKCQIEYYFNENSLARDVYLRKHMDDEGWVAITLIAGFNRVRQMTDDIQLILDSLRTSSVVEVEGKKIRSRHHWKRFNLPREMRICSSEVQSRSLDEKAANHGSGSNEVENLVEGGSSLGESSSQTEEFTGGQGTSQGSF